MQLTHLSTIIEVRIEADTAIPGSLQIYLTDWQVSGYRWQLMDRVERMLPQRGCGGRGGTLGLVEGYVEGNSTSKRNNPLEYGVSSGPLIMAYVTGERHSKVKQV